MPALLSRCIDICKVLRYSCMSIKAVYNIKPLCIFRRLLRQICRASAADDADINVIFVCRQLTDRIYLSTLCRELHRRRIPSRKYTSQLTVRIVPDRSFHTAADISISTIPILTLFIAFLTPFIDADKLLPFADKTISFIQLRTNHLPGAAPAILQTLFYLINRSIALFSSSIASISPDSIASTRQCLM